MCFIKRCSLLAFLFFYHQAFSQYNKLISYTTGQGLSSNHTTCLLQASDGFLWIGTTNGLNRFDGNRFVSFQRNYADSNSPMHNFIINLSEDSSKRLWIVYPKGFSRWNAKDHRFKNYSLDQFSREQNESMISVLSSDAFSVIIVTNRNLYRMEVLSGAVQRLSFAALAAANTTCSIGSALVFDRNRIAVVANRQFFLFNTARNSLETFQHPLLQSAEGVAIALYEPVQKQFFVSSYNKGLLLFNMETKAWKQYSTSPLPFFTGEYDPVYSLRPAGADKYIYSSELGVGLFNYNNFVFEPLLPDSLFTKTIVRHTLIDQQLGIWVATSNGLLKAIKDEVSFRSIAKIPAAKGAFSTVQLAGKDSFLYTSNYGYPPVYRIHLSSKRYEQLPMKNGWVEGVLRYVFNDRSNNTWLSTETAVYMLPAGHTYWEKIPVIVAPLTIAAPRNFVQDKQGRIWLRLRNAGLYVYDPAQKNFTRHETPVLKEGMQFSGMELQRQDTELWLSESNSGFYIVDLVTGKSRFQSTNLPTGLRNYERIASFTDSIIWISDEINGILQYNTLSKNTIHYSTQNGLLTNTNETLHLDPQGRIWTFSAEGISVIEKQTGKIINLQHPNLTRIQNICLSAGGRAYAATDKFIFSWETKDLLVKDESCSLYPDYSTVNNVKQPWLADTILPYSQNDISLHFGVLNWQHNTSSLLEYQFAGDKTWTAIPDKPLLSFFRLPPGRYQLHIRLKNDPDEANWLRAGWQIRKAFWQTAWFWLGVFSVIATGAFLFTRYRFRQLKQQAQLKQKIAETERMALQAQMNPHFIFNCISSIDNFILANDKENASAWLNKFAKLIRSILDSSKHEVIPFWKDWETLQLYAGLEMLRADYRYKVIMQADEALLNGHYRVPPLLVQPYVENAIHHGLLQGNVKEGAIKIYAALTGHTLIYTIEDNGIGRARAATLHALQKPDHYSYGMQMTAERIALFNRSQESSVTITDLHNESGMPCGTRVEIRLSV